MWNLLISRVDDPPGQFFDQRQIDAGELMLGASRRACDVVLGTKADGVSGQHCRIISSGLDLLAVDNGSTNGVALNSPEQRIMPHNPVPIRDGDKLFICSFVVTIASDAMAAGMRMGAPPPQELPKAASGGWDDDPFADAGAASWEDDPFWAGDSSGGEGNLHDLLSDEIGAHIGSSAPSQRDRGRDNFGDPIGMAMSRPILSSEPISAGDMAIPEDWFGGNPGGGGSSASPGVGGEDFFDDIAPPAAGGGAAPEVDFFADMGEPVGDSFEDDPFGDMAPAGGSAASFMDDEFDPVDNLLSEPMAAPPAPPPPPALPTPSPVAAPAPVRATATAPATAPAPAPVPVATAGAADWSAFYEGAGMGPGELRLSPDAMRRLGVMYRQVVLGMSDLMRDRAEFKDEFRVERTQLAIGRNNPLKHLPPQDAAKVLLGDPLPGFQDSEEAIRGAFEDLKRHQLAMLAGVQRALQAVFDRLSPEEIEKLTITANASKKLLSLKVDPWDIYRTVFQALKKDATSNANGVMSVAFREGYEDYLSSAK
ncbi:MAG: type VI secretion system-associated FHA domain protein TagH [Erythrobacter sp.]|nr:MAG: type VI secretion system-associated FHA domain protein TagH [Erythrobacter sp.]